jgi:photosystem II stability/assembly factor-like uncharacterized protein
MTPSFRLLYRNGFALLILVLVLAVASFAQTPQYYNYQNVGTSSNTFPFNQAAGKEVQWLILAGDLNQPSPLPPGNNITTVYFFITTAGSRTYTDLTIRMGQTNITTLPTGSWYTGPMQTVYYRPSVSLTGPANGWMSITLDTPFLYDPTQSLVIEVTQCGATGTGINVRQNTLTGFRRSWSSTATGCPFNWGGQDSAIVNFGVDVVPAGTPGWTQQTSGITTALYTVKAVTPQIAWTAGAGGVVLRTTNGGNTWTSVGGGNLGTSDLYNITATSATTAFTTTSTTTATYLFRTTNGGTSWDTVFVQAGGFLNAIHMFDANNGIAQGDPVGGRWTVIRTSDGGATWVRDTVNAPLQVGGEYGANNGLKAIGTNYIWWTPGTGNGLYRTTNGGTTWTRVTLPGSGFTAGIDFVNTQYGVVGNSAGAAARTTDGGATWTAVTIGTSGALYAVGAGGTLNFWAMRGTSFQKSRNRGATWAQEYTDATAGTIWHTSFVTSGPNVFGWAVTGAGKIYAYFNPADIHDLGVSSLTKLVADQPTRAGNGSTATIAQNTIPDPSTIDGALPPAADGTADEPPVTAKVVIEPLTRPTFSLADTVRFRAIVKNYGTFAESTYQIGWSIDGVNQTPVNNPRPLAAGAQDTLALQWNQGTQGVHVARAWTILASDGNPTNDTATVNFSVGRVPGDTLYTFIVPGQIILGVAKLPSSNKLVFTSGGQSSATVDDNKWVITDLYGTILDTTHLQVNPTTGQGFGFRDLGWDGRWLLTSDDARLRRIDTTTYTEILAPIVTQTNPNRGIAVENPNRIWVSNFTTNPIRIYDTTGAIVRTVGTPSVAPYGLGWDPWTSRNRAWLWYPEPSTTGTSRLSKVDTATGAIVQTFVYTPIAPAGTVGGMEIVNDHPAYPGAVVGFMIIQNFPNSVVLAIYLGRDSSTVDVGPPGAGVPETYVLDQNYPNPFNPSTTIKYGLPEHATISLKIYNLLGQEVANLYEGEQVAGYHEAVWDGRNISGNIVGSGVYFYRLEARPTNGGAPYVSLKKMMVLK